MGTIADDANDVYRDYVTDGVPASGPNEPSKSDIRGLFGVIDQLVGGAISGAVPYDTAAHLPASTNSGKIYLVTSDSTTANNGYWQDQSGGNVILTALNNALKGQNGANGLLTAASHSQLDAGTDDTVSATPASLSYLGISKARIAQLAYLALLASSDDDDSMSSIQGHKIALAFKEAISDAARAFVLADGGFAGKRYTFLFGQQPQDDDAATPVFGLTLEDGKMPLQFDGNWKAFLKLQDRSVAQIGTSLGSGLITLWRGPSGVTDIRVNTAMMRARYKDTTVAPNWRGDLVMPRALGTLAAVAGNTGKLVFLHTVSQSNGLASGSGNPTIFDTSRFPYHAFKFTAGRSGNGDPAQGGALVSQATLNDIVNLHDDTGVASYPGTVQAFLAQYWARWHGVEAPPYLTRVDGLGGIPITYLIKGADSGGSPKYFYVNAQTSRKAALAIADSYGLDLDYQMVFVQGEDPTVATDQYQTYLANSIIDAHLADSVTDIGRRPSSFIIMQTNGLADGSNDQRPGPLAHLAETRRRRGSIVALAGPMYQLPLAAETSTANIHADNVGRLMWSDLRNRVHREIAERGSFTPLDLARKALPALGVNQVIRAPNLSAGTMITALGTGTGGIGTYTLNNTYGSPVASQTFVAFGAVFVGSIAGNTLTVTAILDGQIDVSVSGATVTARLNRPVKIDQDWVPTVGPNLGFTWSDASSRTISGITVDRDIVTITLSGAPTGAKVLGYAIDNCAGAYLRDGGASGTNWAAPRGQIYADSGIEATAWTLGGYGTRTIRDYLVRFSETF